LRSFAVPTSIDAESAGAMLPGLMQDDFQLTLQYVLRRMRSFPDTGGVVTLTDEGTTRASYGQILARVDRLARALGTLGVKRGERVGTFAWNSQRHFECYFAIPCVGAVLNTINLRLFPEQIAYVINHAEDRIVFIDAALAPALARSHRHSGGRALRRDGRRANRRAAAGAPLRGAARSGRSGGGRLPRARRARGGRALLQLGTTGNPKGVLYSHARPRFTRRRS